MTMTKDQIAAYLKSIEGPIGEPDTMPVELGAVRKMALCVENMDSIHYDDAAARRRGYRGIVAPWPYLWLIFFNTADEDFVEMPFGKATIHGGDAYEFHEPIVVGDVITVKAAVTSTSVKEGRSGVLGIFVMERRFYNQMGQLCAVLATTAIRK